MMLEELYLVAFRKKVYTTIEQLQADVDEWLGYYNEERPHSGRYCYGKTPMGRMGRMGRRSRIGRVAARAARAARAADPT